MKACCQLNYDTPFSGYKTHLNFSDVKIWINMCILKSMKYTVFQKYH